MPINHPIRMVDGVIEELSNDLPVSDTDSQRFTVKDNMRFWIRVDFSDPGRAMKLLDPGETIDTADQAVIDILMVQPELTYVGPTPP